MFRIEAAEKKKIETKYENAKEKMLQAERDDAMLRKKVAYLTDEVERKKRLAMQAIAARGQFKDTLHEMQEKIASFESEMAKKN